MRCREARRRGEGEREERRMEKETGREKDRQGSANDLCDEEKLR